LLVDLNWWMGASPALRAELTIEEALSDCSLVPGLEYKFLNEKRWFWE